MTPQSRKAKGRRLQQFVRDRLLLTFPHLADGDIRSTSMGAGGEDLQLSPAARKVIPFAIECKSRAQLKSLYYMMEQARSHGTGAPLVVLKQNRANPLVLLEFETFLELLKNAAQKEDE